MILEIDKRMSAYAIAAIKGGIPLQHFDAEKQKLAAIARLTRSEKMVLKRLGSRLREPGFGSIWNYGTS